MCNINKILGYLSIEIRRSFTCTYYVKHRFHFNSSRSPCQRISKPTRILLFDNNFSPYHQRPSNCMFWANGLGLLISIFLCWLSFQKVTLYYKKFHDQKHTKNKDSLFEDDSVSILLVLWTSNVYGPLRQRFTGVRH